MEQTNQNFHEFPHRYLEGWFFFPVLSSNMYPPLSGCHAASLARMYLHSWRVRLPWMDQSHLIEDPMDWSQQLANHAADHGDDTIQTAWSKRKKTAHA